MERNLNAMNTPCRSEPMGITMKIKQGLVAIALATATLSVQATPATSYYVYDEAGHVIGEYDQNGNPIQEHIYLGDRPVAVVQNGNGSTLEYVTTDQLNTPRAVTDSSQSIEWSLATDPFGNGQPTGSLTYNLRFPGQYYDAETGYNYNMLRDYDASTGRYVESDPIGLKAGVNTYIYVKNEPLVWADRFGLCPNCKKQCDDQYWKDVNDIKDQFESDHWSCAFFDAIEDINYCEDSANATLAAGLIYADVRRKKCLKQCGE